MVGLHLVSLNKHTPKKAAPSKKRQTRLESSSEIARDLANE